MKKKWTKTWALLLALTMAGSLLMACQSSKGGSDAAAGDTAQGADASQDGQDAQTEDTGAQVDPYGPVSEPVTLHIGRSEDTNASYLEGQDSSNNYIVNHISEQLGVEFVYDFSVASDTY